MYGLAVLIERSMHPDWLSNAYLLADEPGGTAVFIDSGAPLEPLHEVVERERLNVTHLLTTHSHSDHVAGDAELVERYGLEIVKGPLETGGLTIEALETPGHADDHLAFVANETVAFTADILFKDAVGGGPDAAPIRRLGDGHADDAARRGARAARATPTRRRSAASGRRTRSSATGAARRASIDEAVRVGGEDATLVVWSPDYDGKGKAMVRFADGREAIVGGSRVERR